MNEKRRLKDLELRLIAELMKNSRRSDRALAKALGVSQPTVSRVIARLEKEGVIREYTMIPDFTRIGFKIMGVSFMKIEEAAERKITPEMRKQTADLERVNPYASLIAVDGEGLEKDRMFLTLYRTYSDYQIAKGMAQKLPFVDVESLESFLVDLENENNYRILSMKTLADNILRSGKHEGKRGARR